MDEEKLHNIEFEMRTVDEYGNEEHMCKKYNPDATDNGMDAYSLYEQVICFMKMTGYCDKTIKHIQWVEDVED